MNFDGPVLAWFTLAIFPIALPIILATILSYVWPAKAGCLPLVILFVIGLASAFGISAYLDSGDSSITGQVLSKKESLVYFRDGSWSRKMVAQIRADSPETSSPIVSLNVLPAKYDELNQGDFVQLVSYDRFGVLHITRLQDQTTASYFWYWVDDQPFLFFFVSGLVLLLAVRFLLHVGLPAVFFLSGVVTIGSWWISAVAVPLWQQSGTLLGSLNTVGANVEEIHPPYLGGGLQGWFSTKILTPYDLILLEIIPIGHTEPIQSVDMVDINSSNLKVGQSVNVEYSAANPRYSIVPDASRSYLWKNGLICTIFAVLAMLGVARLAFLIREQRKKPAAVPAGARKPPPNRP